MFVDEDKIPHGFCISEFKGSSLDGMWTDRFSRAQRDHGRHGQQVVEASHTRAPREELKDHVASFLDA